MEDKKANAGKSDPSEYDEVVITKDTETVDAFSSHVIHVRTGTAYMGTGLNVMDSGPSCTEDGSPPQGLTAQNAYTELHDGSKNIAMIVRNSTVTYPKTLRKKTLVARAVTLTWVPEPSMQTKVMDMLNEAQGLQVHQG